LSTPAGVTPPDATASAANAADVTDVLPALHAADLAQAYSEAVQAVPAATAVEPAVSRSLPQVIVGRAPRANRGPYIIAAVAAAIGLLLGGVGVATVLRNDSNSTPGPPRGEVRSDPAGSAGAAPPLLPPTGSDKPTAAAPAPSDIADVPATVDAPTTTPPPPPPTTEAPTTTPSPSRTTPPTTTRPYPPIYQIPPVPTFDPGGIPNPWGLTPY
ncbi:hypothetical protein ACWELQ_04545, partial [Nocardia sp. NPDC004722]